MNIFNKIFYQKETKIFYLTNLFLSILTFISIIVISLETVNSLKEYKNLFFIFEIIVAFIFFLEYIGRILGTKEKKKYIFSFYGIIDLISFLPVFFGIFNLLFLKSVRFLNFLNIIRILRVIRFLKINEYNFKKEDIDKINLKIYFIFLLIFSFISASLIWFFEEQQSEKFENIPSSFLWSLKVLMGGVNQEIPTTLSGEIILIITRFFGILLFAIMINLVFNLFTKFFLRK